jgi:anti-anti-sigma regulatory factor
MLRIEKDSDGCVTTLRLTGRIQSDSVAGIRSAMNEACTRKILDLTEVTLVDVAVVRFLISCENEGIELVQCPPYVREWIVRERAEGAQPSHDD